MTKLSMSAGRPSKAKAAIKDLEEPKQLYRLTVEVEAEYKKKLKILAAESGVTVASILRDLIRKHFEN